MDLGLTDRGQDDWTPADIPLLLEQLRLAARAAPVVEGAREYDADAKPPGGGDGGERVVVALTVDVIEIAHGGDAVQVRRRSTSHPFPHPCPDDDFPPRPLRPRWC